MNIMNTKKLIIVLGPTASGKTALAIKIAKNKGIQVFERKIKPEEMKSFVGCFLTGTAAEVTPVACIDKYNFKVCNVITDLADSYQGLVRKKKNAA